MISWLTIGLCILAALRPKGGRRRVAMVYSFACLALMAVQSYLPDIEYYIMAGGLSYMVLIYICSHGEFSKFMDDMLYICLASIILNLYGLVSYWYYMSTLGYNLAFQGLYIIAGFVILRRDRENDKVHHRLHLAGVFGNQRGCVGCGVYRETELCRKN